MHRATATIHGWLLLLPAMALLALFTHWPAVATFIDSFYSTPRPRRPARFIGFDNYSQIAADPVFWQSLWNNLLVRARHDPGLHRARDPDGALGQRPHRGPHAHPHGVFHADHPADDRGREHLAVLLHAAIRPARTVDRRVRPLLAQLARLAGHRARRRHRRGDLEGSRLLHDLLSGGAAVDLAVTRRSRRARRRIALDVLPPRAVSAADADHAVRAGQRGDQRLPHGRPHHRDDARRARQCDDAAALLHLSGRLQFLGHEPTRPRSPRSCSAFSRLRRSSNTACSNGGSTTDERAPRSVCAERRLARARKRAQPGCWQFSGYCRSPMRCGRHFIRPSSPRALCCWLR